VIVRCFEGRSMPEVMERVRQELGEDAIILHTQQRRGLLWWFRRTPTIRVWAAVTSKEGVRCDVWGAQKDAEHNPALEHFQPFTQKESEDGKDAGGRESEGAKQGDGSEKGLTGMLAVANPQSPVTPSKQRKRGRKKSTHSTELNEASVESSAAGKKSAKNSRRSQSTNHSELLDLAQRVSGSCNCLPLPFGVRKRLLPKRERWEFCGNVGLTCQPFNDSFHLQSPTLSLKPPQMNGSNPS